MSEIKGDKILIVGFGIEGKSVLAHLQKNHANLEIAVADKNPEAVKGLKLKTYWGESYLNEIESFDTVIKSPGIPPNKAFKKAKYLTTLTNIFFEACLGQTIGITGTKGKSTTSSLIAHILQSFKKDVRLIGNVGNPALDYLKNSLSETIFVMELSSYQLADIHYSPHIAVVLPVYEEHLNYHGNFEAYWQAKANITKYQNEKDYLIYYRGNEITNKIAQESNARKISFDKVGFESQLLGEANKINVAAAFEVAKLFTNNKKEIEKALKSFKPLPYRLEKVGEFKGITFINDSLATIPEATIHALEALEGKVETLIAGGYDRGIDFTKLGEELSKSSIKTLILFPDTGDKIEKALKNNDIKIFKTDNMREAVELSFKHTSKGKAALLSPAATSFNMFKDYKERGDVFRKFVEELGK